jgi:hypothetical protein
MAWHGSNMSRLPEAAAGMSDCFRAAISGSSVTGFGRSATFTPADRQKALPCCLMRPAALRRRKRHPLLALQRPWKLARRSRTCSLLPCALQRFVKSICGSHLDVRLDSRALPVCLGDRVNNERERHPDEKVRNQSASDGAVATRPRIVIARTSDRSFSGNKAAASDDRRTLHAPR